MEKFTFCKVCEPPSKEDRVRCAKSIHFKGWMEDKKMDLLADWVEVLWLVHHDRYSNEFSNARMQRLQWKVIWSWLCFYKKPQHWSSWYSFFNHFSFRVCPKNSWNGIFHAQKSLSSWYLELAWFLRRDNFCCLLDARSWRKQESKVFKNVPYS